MAEKNIGISLLDESEIHLVNKFFNGIHNTTRTDEDFIWLFQSAPAGKSIYVVAKDLDTQMIIGSQCAIPIELITAKGETILTAKSEDTLLDPNYRGLKIFDKMYQKLFEECEKRGIKYIWGFTSAQKPFLKIGFDIQYDHSQGLMVREFIPSYKYLSDLHPSKSLFAKFKMFTLCSMSMLKATKRYCFKAKGIDKYSIIVNDKSSVLDVSKVFRDDSSNFFMIKQDLAYLTWRLVKNTYHKKVLNIYFMLDSQVKGNVIFNYHKDGVWYLVNDVYGNDVSEAEKTEMFRKALKLLIKQEKKDFSLLRTWDFSHNEYVKKEIIRRNAAGLFHLDRGISFVWKGLGNENSLNVKDFVLSRIASQGIS
jgi:hypothetical protein